MKFISSLLVLFLFISVVFCYQEQHESIIARAVRSIINERKEDASSCASHSCASVNQACGWNQIEDVYFKTSCNGGAVCNTTSSENDNNDNNNGKCVKAPKIGESCVALKGRCDKGLICDYNNDKCVLDTPAILSYPPGHSCTNSPFVACYFYNNTNQEIQNSCVNGHCYFTPDFEPCFHTPSECHGTLSFCSDSHICTPYLKLGDQCESENDACNTHSYELCYASNSSSSFGTCKKFHKGTQNQVCISDQHCAEGFFCPVTEEGEKRKTCQKHSDKTNTINKSCISNDDCTIENGEICNCENGTTICSGINNYNNGYWDAFVDVEKCSEMNDQCYIANGDYNLSCLAYSCQSQLCNFYSVVGSDFFLSTSCELHGILSSICSLSSSTSSTTSSLPSSPEYDAIQSFAPILIASPISIVVALFVLFM